jgi:hypoxanthine phosphoribosyltransferase
MLGVAVATGQNAPVAEEREILTYEMFGTSVRELAQRVVDSGYEPDLILSIARGGLGLGMGLGYALDVKNLSAVNVEFYTGVDQRLDVPIMLPPTPAAVDLAGLKVLIADDVADTGKTLEIVRTFCADHVAEARMAVIYEKPWTVVQPDYVWRRTEAWIDFPWSAEPPLVDRSGR